MTTFAKTQGYRDHATAQGCFYIGKARSPNNQTGDKVFLVWDAAFVPIRVDEGGGSFSHHPTEKGWSFRYRVGHKSVWISASIPLQRTLGELIQEAVKAVRATHCVDDGFVFGMNI